MVWKYLHGEDGQGPTNPAVPAKLKVLQLRHAGPAVWYSAIQVVAACSQHTYACLAASLKHAHKHQRKETAAL